MANLDVLGRARLSVSDSLPKELSTEKIDL